MDALAKIAPFALCYAFTKRQRDNTTKTSKSDQSIVEMWAQLAIFIRF